MLQVKMRAIDIRASYIKNSSVLYNKNDLGDNLQNDKIDLA